MSNLLDLANQARQIEEMLAQSEGEITPEIENALKIVDVHLPAKVDSYKVTMDRFTQLSEYYDKRAQEHMAISNRCEEVVDRLRSNLKEAMITSNKCELTGIDHRFTLTSHLGTVLIEDEDKIPAKYKTIKQEIKIDRKRIAEDLKSGETVPGARLEKVNYLRHSANKKGSK